MTNDAFSRWQSRTIEQLGYAVNLILILAVAVLGFSLSLLVNPVFKPLGVAKFLFTLSLLLTLLSICIGIACVITRLEDFRISKEIARVDSNNDTENIASLRERASKLGARTWRLFRFQWRTFGAGVLLMSVSFMIIHQEKLL